MRRSNAAPLLILAVMVAFAFPSPDRGADTVPEAPASGHGRIGLYLTSHALRNDEILRGVLTAGRAGKVNALVINVKNMHGEVTYNSSVPLTRQIGAAVDRVDLPRLLPALREHGFYLIARQVLFYDPLLAQYLGMPEGWVPVDDPIAVAYNLAIAEEVAELGFDEIQFDYVRFPDGGALVPIYEDRYAAVNAFLHKVSERLSGRVALSADVFGRVLWPWNERRIDPIGQSLEDVTRYVDFVSPMIYPSHYAELAYRNDPHLVVSDALTSGNGRTQVSIRPFLQAFDQAIPSGMTLETYIREQIRAAEALGADGYLFWHPACEYTALYRALGG